MVSVFKALIFFCLFATAYSWWGQNNYNPQDVQNFQNGLNNYIQRKQQIYDFVNGNLQNYHQISNQNLEALQNAANIWTTFQNQLRARRSSSDNIQESNEDYA